MREWNAKNLDKVRDRHRTYKRKNPEKFRDSQLRTNFGISSRKYDEMLAEQGEKCAACRTPQPQLKRRLAVDHCHSSGQVRGLLCSNCNTALGLTRDDPLILEGLISYLKITRTDQQEKRHEK
ncbi:hypothetical protein BMW22_15640 [Rhizobium leguminosarum]|uniref:Recombination endonuclease VII n=2 Tax=Rhizobium leguminosarum TaxID=384 RepID=A0A1L3ZB72_RHILE|nr:hypothetical protein BMW22_15640 [Rhizobium leguminosarum]